MADAHVGRAARLIARDGSVPVRLAQIAREVTRDGDPPVKVAGMVRGVARDGSPPVRVASLSRQTLHAATAEARVTQLRRMIVRSRRDSPYPNFPVRLFSPPSLTVQLEGGATSGGVSVSGDQQLVRMGKGGRWTMTFGEAPLWSPAMLKTWRMFVGAADGGVRGVIVPMWDRRHQPFAVTKYEGDTTFGQIVWRDFNTFDSTEAPATVATTTEAEAVELDIAFAGPVAPTGGEVFSIYGPRYGWRLYMIIRMDGDTAIIRPPLREWVKAGTRLNFDSPRCTMRVEGDMAAAVERLRFGSGQATFVETFNRYP